ncbi:hypothetical protein LAZ67_12000264 [Cordylochernes scorpioides]|uniref:RNase H type-1 domain-containing protein n=1 Tax=Cordylochernes scorpioides TaxID=51811 RepID=A0ABY6L0E5_9ARAC|nr:hypothetical protein LAZ67_12000264 [Cordylochernes scorpioides]
MLNGTVIDGRKIRVDFSITRRAHTPTPTWDVQPILRSMKYANQIHSQSVFRTVGAETTHVHQEESPSRYFSCRGAFLSVELHGFCDPSEVAYAAIFYIRSHFKSGQVKVSLIASKTRVAPLKMISIPRLELCAALLLATLYDTISNSLCLQIDIVFLWTDSKIVLSWIKSESRHWKPFVGNRIAEVQRLTLHSSWHYVISKDNPADCASRGITPSELVDHSLWWRGPTWLSDVNFEDPIQTQYDFPKEISGERRKTFSVFHSTNLLFPDFIFKYSNINEHVRITAWIYRFVFNVQCSFNERKKGHLSSSELTSSIQNIIRFIQSSEFQSEITCCKQKKSSPNIKEGDLILRSRIPYHHQQCIGALVASPKSFRERTEKFESSR